MNNVAHFSGKIYPDRKFSIGLVAKKKISKDVQEYNRDYENQFDSYDYQYNKYGRTERRTHKFFDKSITPDRFIKGKESSRDVNPYGRKGITGYGKKVLSNIPLLLQQKYTRKCLGFFTATLPNLSLVQLKHILSKWGDLTRRFFQKIKRIYSKSKAKFLYCSCTEIQEKRYQRTSQAYPHLHWVANAKVSSKSNFIITADDLRVAWMQSVREVMHGCIEAYNCSFEDYLASIDAQVVKKSASAYLGKYVSKGTKVVGKMLEDGYESLPKQWWSASAQAKKMFKASIIYIDKNTASHIFYEAGDYLEEKRILWFNYLFREFNGEERCFGCYGTMSKDMYQAFLS